MSEEEKIEKTNAESETPNAENIEVKSTDNKSVNSELTNANEEIKIQSLAIA